MNGGGKEQRFPARSMVLVGRQNVFGRVHLYQHVCHVRIDEIPCPRPQLPKVNVQLNLDGAQISQMACHDHFEQGLPIDDLLKDMVEADPVTTHRCCSHTQCQ